MTGTCQKQIFFLYVNISISTDIFIKNQCTWRQRYITFIYKPIFQHTELLYSLESSVAFSRVIFTWVSRRKVTSCQYWVSYKENKIENLKGLKYTIASSKPVILMSSFRSDEEIYICRTIQIIFYFLSVFS